MADEDEGGENLVVSLDDEEEKTTPPPPAGEKPAAPAAKPPPVPGPSAAPPPPSQTGLAELQQQMQAERAERLRVTEAARQIAAERDQMMMLAQEAERRGVSTFELYNEGQIKATEDKIIALAGASEVAYADGDFKRVAALNLEIGRLGGDLGVLKRDHQILQQQREQMAQPQRPPPQQPRQQQPQQPQQPADPLERAIQGRTDATKNFLRKHPELIRGDGSLKRTAIEAHERALDDGFAADTPGYFEHIEKSLNMVQTPGQPPQPSAPRGQAPTLAAPVARAGGPAGSGGSPGGNGLFTMTPKMRRLAEEQGVTPQEWAKNYVRLLAEGRITPIT